MLVEVKCPSCSSKFTITDDEYISAFSATCSECGAQFNLHDDKVERKTQYEPLPKSMYIAKAFEIKGVMTRWQKIYNQVDAIGSILLGCYIIACIFFVVNAISCNDAAPIIGAVLSLILAFVQSVLNRFVLNLIASQYNILELLQSK